MMRVYEFDDAVLTPERFRFHVLRCLSVKKYHPNLVVRLLEKQKRVCPLCKDKERLLNVKTCVVDHKRTVKSFAYDLSVPLTKAYLRCRALNNLRAVHRKCNNKRNRKSAK